MRFRLGINAAGAQQLNDGVTNGMRSLFQLPLMRAQAEEQARTADARQRLYESQIADHVAQAAIREEERKRLAGSGDVLDTIIATQAGTDVPTVRRWRDSVQSGVPLATGSATGDPQTDEMIGIKPEPAIDPKVAQALGLQFQRLAPAMVNPKSFTVQGQSTAAGNYQQQDAIDRIVADPSLAPNYGQAYAATDGKPLVDNVGNTGAGFNRFTGEGVTIDPAMKALFGDQGAALVRERNAGAGQKGAAAALSNARRERVQGGYDKPVTILDEDTNAAQITRLPTGGQPVTVGVAPQKKTGVDATNAKERNRVVAAVEKEMPLASDAEIQAEVDRRMARRGSAAPAPAKPAAPAAPQIDMGKAAKIKADVKAGKLTREQGIAQLRALGFK